jgi:large conductance mechanosensitive channel
MAMLKGFKNFLMRGDVIVVASGAGFQQSGQGIHRQHHQPADRAVQPGNVGPGLGWQLVKGGGEGTFLNLGGFVSAIIYFIVFMAVVYFVIVLPYKTVMARQGKTVFGDPPATKTCPACLSDDLNAAATKCKHCGSEISRITPAAR